MYIKNAKTKNQKQEEFLMKNLEITNTNFFYENRKLFNYRTHASTSWYAIVLVNHDYCKVVYDGNGNYKISGTGIFEGVNAANFFVLVTDDDDKNLPTFTIYGLFFRANHISKIIEFGTPSDEDALVKLMIPPKNLRAVNVFNIIEKSNGQLIFSHAQQFGENGIKDLTLELETLNFFTNTPEVDLYVKKIIP